MAAWMKCVVTVILMFSLSARASIFGEENIPLYSILANAIQQLAQLRSILESGKESLQLMRDIHKGINDSLNMIHTVDPNGNPGLYGDWDSADQALSQLEQIYGAIPNNTTESQVQRDSDQSVAEAVALNNSIYDYTKEIDRLGEDIKSASHSVSPGGAQKLTAESLGVMLHVMNASLRAQATSLKLQAQAVAVKNRQDKESTRHAVNDIHSIEREYNRKAKFAIPRF